MKEYPWWTETQKKLAREAKEFVDGYMARAEEISWTREFPWDMVEEVGKRGWCGAAIPKEYGGMGEESGVTGTCILYEEFGRLPGGTGMWYGNTNFGGVQEIVLFGSDEQKRRWLPKLARGEAQGAITITEPFVGSDAASIQDDARRDGDDYVINGKKRFITNAGVADIYMAYVRTSSRPEDRARRRHLSAIVIEKGIPGFTIERMNELSGYPVIRNGVLDFDEARVPVANRLLEEGDGWKVLTSGLNFERVMVAVEQIGHMREALAYATTYTQRRVQFGRPVIDNQAIQFKIADMIEKLEIARLYTYHTAYLIDQGQNPALEATVAKLYTTEAAMEVTLEAVQCMGGDGYSQFYPVERLMREAKLNVIGAGTSETMRGLIYRQALRSMADDLKAPNRRMHPTLGIAVPAGLPEKGKGSGEDQLLGLLAEDYRANPGLFMARAEMKQAMGVGDKELDGLLTSLESQALVGLLRQGETITLAKATYAGLKKANPKEHYRWIPSWAEKDVF